MIRHLEWNGDQAIEHRLGMFTLATVPARGGKIVSIRDVSDTEWLAQPSLPQPEPAREGRDFVSADMSGWDECAPSIIACTMPDGTRIPDHGELWAKQWAVDGEVQSVRGASFDYLLSRSIDMVDDHTIRIEYIVRAGARDIPFLWGAHPQFLAPPRTRIEFGTTPGEVFDVLGTDPVATDWNDELAEIDSVDAGDSRKFYLPPRSAADHVSLIRPDSTLTMRWDARILPFLGVWFDAARFSREPVIALEPSTGWYDDASRALDRGMLPIVRGGTSFSWWLELVFG